MSTSLLYHGFGVRGYKYVKTEYVEGEVIFTIEQPRESYCCSACGSEDVIGRGQNPCLLRPSHLNRPSGRHQQQDQDHETSSLRIPRSRVLPTQNPRNPSNQVRFSRMNLI